jgi:hypothetical protein
VALRIIDIKKTAEPSPDHFAEVTLYSMALAGWLVDQELDDRYVVVPDAAIWPGSHDVSSLVKMSGEISLQGRAPTIDELKRAMKKDLKPVPFEVFASRIRQFLHDEIADVLDPSRPWDSLHWHIDTRCKGCDYVGYLNWRNKEGEYTWDPKHCMPMAERNDNLCRVPGLTRGARAALESGPFPITSVSTLASVNPADPRLDVNHTVRAVKFVIPERATALLERQAFIAQQSGTSCTMPKWADLRIYISVNFDVGSGITFAMGLYAVWGEPWSDTVTTRRKYEWPALTFIIEHRDLLVEQKQLLDLLNAINKILSYAYELHKETKVQLYIWDSIQYKHLTRIVGRHLSAILENPDISHLAWLFPPEELEPNPRMESRRSPITVLKDVIQSLLAAPVPYYYTLFTVARTYHEDFFNPRQLNVVQLFEDQLSAQIPSERAHDIWVQNEYSEERCSILKRTVLAQLKALETVTRRLEDDLRPSLNQYAPKVKIGPPDHYYTISSDGQLWLTFALLDSALGELEVHQARAMPPHEREARFKSARLIRRITGEEEAQKLKELGISPRAGRRVYEMRKTSREVKLREGDFDFALSPGEDAGFLDIKVPRKTESTPLPKDGFWWQKRMEDVTAVTVTRIDRDAGIIVLDPDARYPSWLDDLEAYNVADFSKDVTLDPRWTEKLTKKLKKTLEEIRNPSNAEDNPVVQRAVSGAKRYRTRVTERHPAGDILWSAWELSQPRIERDLQDVQNKLDPGIIRLNESQWKAWELALTHRVQLIWGPPGTGKTRTLQAVTLGALLDASKQERPNRILLCAPTYNALDNVLLDVNSKIKSITPDAHICVKRLRSKFRKAEEKSRDIDLELNVANPTSDVQALRQRLIENRGITLVGTTPQQVHNFLVLNDNPPMAPLFDMILLDEASQMDVANAILAIAAIADDGALTIAGDPQQLPPIHKAQPPAGLECMVGSVFNYFRHRHKLIDYPLEMNYRSNQTIVDFAHEAGYPRSLKSYSPNLCMNLVKALPLKSAPANWPSILWWTPHWASLLDPNRSATCFVYAEGMSGQSNPFEADTIAALVFSLFRRLGKQPLFERDPDTGEIKKADKTAYQDNEFWEDGVGIVTPHRAQQALIISKLQDIFAPLGIKKTLIRDAVDTVERFQGQQRQVIIASYALGDQDLIRDEDEFLMSLNRFNVMVSRARTKIITLVSQEVINHLSLDVEILWESRLLKLFADSFCKKAEPMTLKYYDKEGGEQTREGVYKYRENRAQ